MSCTPVLRSWIKALACLLLVCFCAGCGQKEAPVPAQTTTSGKTEELHFTETDEETDTVKLEMTDGGIMLIELYPDIAPITVANFKKLVSEHFYDGLIFHRVIADFMIQTGDPTGLGSGGSKETIFGEFGTNGYSNTLLHERGVVSMARNSYDNNSASSQFFIVHKDYPSLNGNYASFGKVIAGMDVVDAIAATPTDSHDRPLTEQKIATVRFVETQAEWFFS